MKLIKETIEKTMDENNEEVMTTISAEYSIQTEDGKSGSVNISKHGVSFNLYGGEFDIEEWKTKITELLTINKESNE